MTREEAIKNLQFVRNALNDSKIAKAYDMAIKALEQEPCEDCVRRQEVLDILKDEWNTCLDANDAMQESIDTIEALKSVTPQPKMGRWITKIKSDLRGDMWPTNPKCSECGGEPYYSNTIYNYKFCPNCGAKMESEDKNG